ncbi:hypothetical protein D3C73_1133590 [compost metagenome]
MAGPVPLLMHLEAHTVEADVNHDGVTEIIATVGTLAQTSIYKLSGEKIVVAHLNEQIKAQAVMYDTQTNIFQADITKDRLSKWKLLEDQLQWIP